MKKIMIVGVALFLATPVWAQDAGAVFAALDANHDGKVTQAEAQKNPAVMQAFAQADKNRDGSLSKAEFDAAFGK
jgi:Ca2+-binding EF-hand superfamily protein